MTLQPGKALPRAHDGAGLIERMAELYTGSATQAEANSVRNLAMKDPRASDFNLGWAAAMKHAAEIARAALKGYRGDPVR